MIRPDPGSSRRLRTEERNLLAAIAPQLAADLDTALVCDMQDGGMGSIAFVPREGRRRARAIAEAQYVDLDNVLVSIELNVDDSGQLLEMDFWKVDFSPLRRYPSPADLKESPK